MKWAIVGFLLTLSYKSVLRAILMKTEYEDTIDTIDDLLQSDRQLVIAADTPLKSWVESDPREKVQALNRAKQTKYFNLGIGDGEQRMKFAKE